jgi:hypothetical protein
MDDILEDKSKQEEQKKPEKATKGRKYIWTGIKPRNPALYNQYGSVKIKPWAMSDEEIDALLKRHPELGRLWKKGQD